MVEIGIATGNGETFEFTISPLPTGGFRLDNRYSGTCHENITGAGLWPTVEKARQIAETTAHRLLGGSQRDVEDTVGSNRKCRKGGSVLSCLPSKLAYFEDEEKQRLLEC